MDLHYLAAHTGIYFKVPRNACRGSAQRIIYLYYVSDRLWMQEMYNKIMGTMPNAFHRIADQFKTQEMFNKAVEVDPWQMKDVPNHFKTQEMCNKTMKYYPFSLQFVPDWSVTQQQIDIWYDDDYVYNDNEMTEWSDP